MTANLYEFLYKAYCELSQMFSLKLICATIIGAYSLLLGTTNPELIYAIMTLIGIDFITGVSASKVQGHTIKSYIAFRTPLKAFIYLLMIIAAHQVGILIPQVDVFLIGSMSGFLGLNEMISIIENFGRMGYKIPRKILNQLTEMNNERE